MSRKIMSLLFSAVMLVCGCSRSPSVDMEMFSQDAVCDLSQDLNKYSILEYVDERKIIIPALKQNFVPQGIAYWDAKNWLILSGYFYPVINEIKSAILAVDASTGKLEGAYALVDEYNRRIEGHFSGVAVTDRDLYISHEAYLLQVPLATLKDSGSDGVLRIANRHSIDIDDGSCNYADGILWVCEHYRNCDAEYYGRMIGYKIDKNGGLKPYCAFHVPEKVQGITVSEDRRLFFSISYGRTNPSEMLVFHDPRIYTPDGYELIDNTRVAFWDLEQGKADIRLSAPPMSEGCCAVGNKVYLIFESAAYFYRVFEIDHRSVDPTDRIWQLDFSNAHFNTPVA